MVAVTAALHVCDCLVREGVRRGREMRTVSAGMERGGGSAGRRHARMEWREGRRCKRSGKMCSNAPLPRRQRHFAS